MAIKDSKELANDLNLELLPKGTINFIPKDKSQAFKFKLSEDLTFKDRSDFQTSVKSLFDNSYYMDKGFFKNELDYIFYFLEKYPQEYKEEIFFGICLEFLKSPIYKWNESTSNHAVSLFIELLKKEEFKDIVNKIKDNVNAPEIYYFIKIAISTDQLTNAQYLIDIFLQEEQKDINLLDPKSYYDKKDFVDGLLIKNNKTAISFLLDNFKGFDNSIVLGLMFEKSTLDNSVVDRLLLELNDESNKKLTATSMFLNRKDLTLKRKIEVLTRVVGESNIITDNIRTFYTKQIDQENLNINTLIKNEDKIIKILRSKEYISGLINKRGNGFVDEAEKLFKTFKIDNLSLNDLYVSYFKDVTDYNSVDFDSILEKALKISNVSDENKEIIFNAVLERVKHDIDYSKESFYFKYFETLSEEKKAILKEKLMKYENRFAYTYLLKNSSDYIYKKMANDFSNYHNSTYRTLNINSEQQIILYNEIRKTKSSNEVIDILINEKSNFGYSFIDLILKGLSSEKEIIIDFREETKIHKYYQNNGRNDTFLKINEVFDHKLEECVKQDNKKQKRFFSFLKDEPILQIIKTNEKVEIIKDPNLIKNNSNSAEQEIDIQTSSFDEIIKQNKEDLKKLNLIFKKSEDTNINLNLEFKIRAESIFMQNLDFLNKIKPIIDDIDLTDIYFLRNNMGKYLVQCAQTYTKMLSRQQTMVNSSSLFKKSEADLDAQKEKLDIEALKQVALLEKELEIVKGHIHDLISQDNLSSMRVNTRLIQSHVNETLSTTQPTEGKLVALKK